MAEPVVTYDPPALKALLEERFAGLDGVLPGGGDFTFINVFWHDCHFGIELPSSTVAGTDIVTVRPRYGDGWFEDYNVPQVEWTPTSVALDDLNIEFLNKHYDTALCAA